MALFIFLLLFANVLICYFCYLKATEKGYPKVIFAVLGAIPYFNLVVLVYLLFLPNVKADTLLNSKAAS
ncbi:hypothetical protein [Pseudoalteromonas piratica]|uniref:Cardiolipin synthase N-terminal domain-containing protein n=1 Tax=Pseudoalteromonas piratica TaxID=1348114 RepID=A0A0A7ECK6_9GAMM|nr:hypothetical protein [Pseudoalteromonas piratica]AIY63767.1 hypothetical protein OM33_00260 [Pseudoalteromonas piratica]